MWDSTGLNNTEEQGKCSCFLIKQVKIKNSEFSQKGNAEYHGGQFLSLLELDLVLVPSGSSLVQGSGLLASGMAPDNLRTLKGDSFPRDHFQYLLNNAIVTERKFSANFIFVLFSNYKRKWTSIPLDVSSLWKATFEVVCITSFYDCVDVLLSLVLLTKK